MRLISCHVENFGCLHEFDYIFKDGVNVICRENGWGKSTFAAFLLAMFYGLPSKGKRGQTLSAEAGFSAMNARAAYRPWQGGVFGGRLVFEAGGRIYEAARLFGERESQDEFDLRDLETNLPSFDYSPDLGKELFRVDRESFVRTVFTAQQDCRTRPTDDVNALITDLARNAGDMESYASAQKRLKEAANRLTPRRASGRIHRLEERIEELERSTAASAGIEESIALCDQKRANWIAKRANWKTSSSVLKKRFPRRNKTRKMRQIWKGPIRAFRQSIRSGRAFTGQTYAEVKECRQHRHFFRAASHRAQRRISFCKAAGRSNGWKNVCRYRCSLKKSRRD